MDDVAWKEYDGKEPLETFLEGNRPSKTQEHEAPWICVRYEDGKRDDVEKEENEAPWICVRYKHGKRNDVEEEENEATGCDEPDEDAMMTEWEGLVKNNYLKKPAETLKDLAIKYKHTSGKWMIFAGSDFIDDLWFTVAKAVVAGKLWDVAKVSSKNSNSTHVICVYSKDFTDEDDVRRVEKGLRDSGIRVGMMYKPDIYTSLNIYSNNQFNIPPSVFKSQAI